MRSAWPRPTTLARRLREELTEFLSEDYAPLADLLNEVRMELRRHDIAVEGDVWNAAIDGRLRALLVQRRPDAAREHLLQRLGVAEALASTGAAEP
jgi:hypothetical protein